jgi:hypothetical protein
MITQARLKELLHYDPDTGVFTYRVTSRWYTAGGVAGGLTPVGYRTIGIDRKGHLAHRLAVLYMTGAMPPSDVDHVNGVKSDNRWRNLRVATRGENQQNIRGPRGHNKTGLLGVRLWRGKFRAQIVHAGKQFYLGCFSTPEEAHAAYLKAKAELHPFSTL